jgi:hypothetical protein
LGSAYIAYRLAQPLFWLAGLAAGYGTFRFVNRSLLDYATQGKDGHGDGRQTQLLPLLLPFRFARGGVDDDLLRSKTGELLNSLITSGDAISLNNETGENGVTVGIPISMSRQVFMMWPPVVGHTNKLHAVMPVYNRQQHMVAWAHVKAHLGGDGEVEFDELIVEYLESGRRVCISDPDLLKRHRSKRRWIDVEH